MTVLLDTNIVLEHLRSGILVHCHPSTRFALSVISIAELLRYPGLKTSEIETIEEFIRITFPITIDESIARKAASLGKTRKTKLPDLLIAASAITWNIPLITENLRDFRGIPNLKVRKRP